MHVIWVTLPLPSILQFVVFSRDFDLQRNGSLGEKRRNTRQLRRNKFRTRKFSRIKHSISRHTRLEHVIAQIMAQNA
jgi:hypothetical protein